MCDYSLHAVANRPAKVGDELVSTNFDSTFTGGFTEIGEPTVAVCLMPGTELAFERDVEVHHIFRGILARCGFGKTGQRVARFRQINMNLPHTHHDALEFPNGKIVLVTRLCPGQKATVLQLPATIKEHQRHQLAAAPETPASVAQTS
jgi:hypothetical protein